MGTKIRYGIVILVLLEQIVMEMSCINMLKVYRIEYKGKCVYIK